MLEKNEKQSSSLRQQSQELRIAVIDEAEKLQDIIRETFASNLPDTRTSFFETDCYNTALKNIGSGGCDLVFINWDIPLMDCLELVKDIRKLNSSIPIMMITSLLDEKVLLEAGDAGVNTYIEKPIRSQQLWKQIREFVS